MSTPAEDDLPDHVADADLAPAEAFALLGNETRIEILQALHEETVERESDAPVPFSALYDRVDIDDSAHFNYHLKQLLDHFVRKTDDGYVFRTPGWKVVRSVFAGTFTGRAEVGPVDAPGDCYACGGPLRATYAEERLTIDCGDCGRQHVHYSFPPGGLDGRRPAEFLDAFHHHVRHHYCLAADGVCPECMGQMRTELDADTELPGQEVAVRHVCGRCDNRLTSAVGLNLLDTAAVLTFHADRGVDLTTQPFWTHDWCVSDERTTVESADPVTVRLDIPCDGDVLSVTLDETLSVLDVEVTEDADPDAAGDDRTAALDA
ncbi:winged helix-turn-helix domain-containing protein [Halobaculum sp. D14]|uniref:winged helix-turn-helix domain-containing protein n=1 Tax=unclassified Halobaculum TaxID=2640896 RepID=UPI003EB8C92F